jgi:hypothetical protein
MKTLWPAATLAIAITGYFAWSSFSASEGQSRVHLDDCHRLAGQVQATHESGGTIGHELLVSARGCSVAFGQDWAADSSARAAGLRAEGASLVQ